MGSVGRVVRGLLAGTGFLFFGAGGLLLSWTILPVLRRRANDGPTRSALSREAVRRAFMLFHDYLRVLHLVRCNPRHHADALPTEPAVVVANHPTLIDVTAIMAADPSLICLVKPSHFRGWLLGPLLRYCWHVPSVVGHAAAGAGVIVESLRRLEAGLPVLIFPEGTRSPVGGLNRFRRGAFEIACRGGVPVVPLHVEMNPPMLSKHAPWYMAPSRTPDLTVTALPRMDPTDFGNDSRAMARAAEAGYKRVLAGQALVSWHDDETVKNRSERTSEQP